MSVASHSALPCARLTGAWLLAATIGAVLALPSLVGADEAKPQARPSELPYDAPGAIPSLDPDYRRTSHKVVLITDDALSPRLVTLEEGQLVAWISYAKSPSTIVFEREVARSMICHSLVNFSIEDDELKSAEIHPGEFASFCQLKPGRYRYKVVRRNPKAGGHDTGKSRIDGVIIVGNPPGDA
jgi:hypothetical protein